VKTEIDIVKSKKWSL